MKILTKKKQKEILRQLFEISKACTMYVPTSGGKYEDRTNYAKVCDEIYGIAESVGGLKGAYALNHKTMDFCVELIAEADKRTVEKDHE